MSKKVILFIVEGISDENSLSLILSRLIKSNKVEFYVVGGDITSENGTTLQNCITKVNNCINRFLKENKFSKKDILRVIHLVDTDGTYINDDFVKQSPTNELIYEEECIWAKDIKFICDRNKRKSSILNKLYSTPKISGADYSMYYFSCNLDHVLHDEQNLNGNLKCDYADKFIERYDGKEKEFIKFLNESDFAVSGDYNQSWNFIKEELNSLKRNCNLHLLLNEYLRE
ncbi:TPA: hypothetical protein I9071_001653 [Clostridium perfringens]|nr:hypothetical protein [Clostridium perfringens]HAT4329484.1 hypothetical protein [Clostridium perfringens]